MLELLKPSNRHLFNPANERLIYKYLAQRKATNQRNDDKTLAALHKSIRSYEILTDFTDFSRYTPARATEFLNKLRDMELSECYLLRLVMDTRDFLRWYSRECRKIKENDLDYLTLTRNELNRARAPSFQESHSFKTLLAVARQMPSTNIRQRRDRALFALAVLGSFRAEELRNMTLGSLHHDSEVPAWFIAIEPRKIKNVKFSQYREATLLSVFDLQQYVFDWLDELRAKEKFTDNDPMFPSITSNFNKKLQLSDNIQRKSLCAGSVREVFVSAYAAAGVKYIRIHSIRHSKARFVQDKTHDNLNIALQQDFGHKNIATTRYSYGSLSATDQRRLISGLKLESEQ